MLSSARELSLRTDMLSQLQACWFLLGERETNMEWKSKTEVREANLR